MEWIRSHLGLIGVAALVGAMVGGMASYAGTPASALPVPFLITFVIVLAAGVALDRAATNASRRR